MTEAKKCIDCGNTKPLTEFAKSGLGIRHACKVCVGRERAELRERAPIFYTLQVERLTAKHARRLAAL